MLTRSTAVPQHSDKGTAQQSFNDRSGAMNSQSSNYNPTSAVSSNFLAPRVLPSPPAAGRADGRWMSVAERWRRERRDAIVQQRREQPVDVHRRGRTEEVEAGAQRSSVAVATSATSPTPVFRSPYVPSPSPSDFSNPSVRPRALCEPITCASLGQRRRPEPRLHGKGQSQA